MIKRIVSTTLILLHIVLVIAPDASAMSSASYRIDASSATEGGNDKGASTSYKVGLDVIGLAVAGVSTSASYKLSSGLIYQVLSAPPVFSGEIANQQWKENESKTDAFDLDDYFSCENPPLVYAVRYETAGHKITVAIDADTNKVSFSQPEAYYGTETISFQAKDAENNETWSNSVQLTVEGVENAPILDFIPDITVSENELVQITPHATDLDGDNIAYAFTSPLDTDGKWQTDYTSSGVYTVRVTATDDSAEHLSAYQDVKITVKDVNKPPVLGHIDDITANEGDVIALTPAASDPDDNDLTFYYSSPFDSQGKWITDYDDEGVYTITVTVTDTIDSASQDVKVTVNNTNRPPEITLTASDNTINPNDTITINLSAQDPDSDAMTYKIEIDGSQIDSGALNGTVSINKSFAAPGDYTIRATVVDTNSDPKTATSQTVVNVIDPNQNRDSIIPILGDFNGDALTDLGYHNTDNGVWNIGLSQEGIFTYTTNWLADFGKSKDWIPIAGDFNADAYQDIGIYNNITGECKIALNDKNNKFADNGQWIKFDSASYDWQVLTSDFNNDGKTDLAVYNARTGELRAALSDGAKFASFQTKITGFSDSGDWQAMMADVNGDSLADLVIFKKSSGEWKVALYTGNLFVDTGVWLSNFAKDKQPLLADFNNDGTTDIGYWDSGSASIKYAISTGSTFQDKGTFKDGLPASAGDFVYVADFNGDGLSDIAFFDKTKQGIECWCVILADAKPSDLLTGVENGTGGKIEITYDYAAKSDNALLPFPVYVVTKVSAVDMLPADEPQETYTQQLSYSGGWFDSDEREFRGFKTATVTDPITGNFSRTTFHQGKYPEDGSLKGRIKIVEAYDGNAKLISKTENTWLVRKGGPLADGIGFPYLESTKNTVNEENNASIITEDTFIYDGVGNVTEALTKGDIALTGDERKTATTYNPPYETGHNTPKLVRLLDAGSNVVNQSSFEYDAKGNLTKQTVYIDGTDNDPSTTYTYDDLGNVLTATDPLGRTSSTIYDDVVYAYAVETTNSLGHTAKAAYDYKLGLVTSATDPNNNTSTTAYDSLARPVQKTNANGDIVTTIEYPDFNTVITTQGSIVSKQYVDGLGRRYLTKSQAEDGDNLAWVVSEVAYNNRGAVESESMPHYENDTDIAYTRYEYDIRGRAIKVIADFTGVTKDADTRIEYMTPLSVRSYDAMGHRKDTVKDVYGRTIEIIEYTADGVWHTYYEYDIKDNLTKLTDAKGNITTITYDTLARKTQMNDPDMGVWKYEYDKVGNLIKQTDAKNQVITFEYDALNRLTRKLANAQTLATYFYDDASKSNCIGRLSKVIDQNCQTEFFYDNLGREVKSTKTIDGTTYTVEREYDTLNRLTKLTYPDNEAVLYFYDANSGLLEKVLGNSTYVSDIRYNAKGQILTIDYGNGTKTAYTYGQDLRLSNILTRSPANPQTLQNLYYDFDKNGNLVSLADNITAKTRTFEYDDLDRLTYARNIPTPDGFGTEQNYRYDEIGNMTYKSDVGTFTYGQNAGPHAVTSAGGYSYSYDANGNMISGRGKAFTYDAQNRLTQVAEGATTTTFTYDGDGGRIKKSTGSISTVYIGSLFEIEADGTTTKHIFAGANRACSVKSTGEAYYTHTDHLGSSNIITDSAGNQVQHCEYAPYGTLTVNTGTDVTRHKFTGKELDASTGLYFYAWRYYDPQLGRFTQADTIVPNPSNPQDLNRYSYCNNNPINYTDPTGHFKWKKFFHSAVGALVGGIVAGVLTGGFGFGLTAAGFWGGLAGGAVTGGLEGGWKGTLRGAAFGGALGAVGGWGVGNIGKGFGYAMFAAGAGYSAATGNLDSFAGGFMGGMVGYMSGYGFGKSESFQNWRMGNGFQSNNAVLASGRIKDPLVIKPFGRNLTWAGGADHTGWATEDGQPLLDMGPQKGTGKIRLNLYQSLNGNKPTMGAEATWTDTTKAFTTEKLIYGTSRVVSAQAFLDAAGTYSAQHINSQYNPFFENSNFAADWIGSHSGAGYATVPGCWAPCGFSFPWDN